MNFRKILKVLSYILYPVSLYIFINYIGKPISHETNCKNFIKAIEIIYSPVLNDYVTRGLAKVIINDTELSASVIEGKPHEILVIVEFNDSKTANDFFYSKGYQEVINFRKQGTRGWVSITDGIQS